MATISALPHTPPSQGQQDRSQREAAQRVACCRLLGRGRAESGGPRARRCDTDSPCLRPCRRQMHVDRFRVESPNVVYGGEFIESTFKYDTTRIEQAADGGIIVKPVQQTFQFRTGTALPKLG